MNIPYNVIEVNSKIVRVSLRGKTLSISKDRVEKIVGRIVSSIEDCQNALLDITGEA